MPAEATAPVEPLRPGWSTYYPIHMPPLYHRDFVNFRAQLQADQEAGLWGPHITFATWMAARCYLEETDNSRAPLYPPRRPTLHWSEFPAAHYFLLGYLGQYEGLTSARDRRILIWHVTNELLTDGYIMDEFEEDGFTAGDVRRVSDHSTDGNQRR